MPKFSIPNGLTAKERDVYYIILAVKLDRIAKGFSPPKTLVISDPAKDYNDLIALVLLKEFGRLEIGGISGFLANLVPAFKRALYIGGAMNDLSVKALLGVGSKGTEKALEYHDWEFEASFMLDAALEDAVEENQKVNLLLISSLMDINNYAKAYPKTFRKAVGRVYMQGGYSVSPEGTLIPHMVANNIFDFPSAKEFYERLATEAIPSNVYTRIAAYATEILAKVFHDLEATRHSVGTHLRPRHLKQNTAFYEKACSPNPFGTMTQENFLHNKTSFYKKHPPGPLRLENGTPLPLDGTPLPKGEEIQPYLTVVVVYDALAALASGGDDLIAALGVLDTESMAT